MKCGCVIQGDIRRGTIEILSEMCRHFPVVVLSTWRNDKDKIPAGNFNVVLNNRPQNPGITNRNLQRLTSSQGISCAKAAGCSHVLKWRTDMLPTKLDVNQLLRWCEFNVPKGFNSRIVTCAFRNMTVKPDWFSSIPDLFAFADIEMMDLLWGDQDFDLSKPMNIPNTMMKEINKDWYNDTDVTRNYYAETELYAHYKNRLQKKTGISLCHLKIAQNYMRLIDHRRLGICWFGGQKGFRSIMQALEYPWWTEKTWQKGNYKVIEWDYPDQPFFLCRRGLTHLIIRKEILLQQFWLAKHNFLKNNNRKVNK